MKILLSPAKMMSLETNANWRKTIPKFLGHSEEIMNVLKNLNEKELVYLMGISNEIASLNLNRNKQWNVNPNNNQCAAAMLAFKGEVYRGLDASTLDKKSITYINNNVYILSGLYGLLRPTDKIMPYRLEMGTKLDVNDSTNLYNYWKEIITPFLNSKINKNEFILNLSSNEYIKVLNKRELKVPIIDVDFLDYKDGKLKKIMMYFKHARGSMTRFCAENSIETLDGVKSFNYDGYRFDENLSKENLLVFTR